VPELVLHAREFDFPRARPLRAGVHYLGPCVDLERAAPAVGLPEIPRGRRIVFCSLGTIRARRERVATFLRRVIAAFRGSTEHALVIATGDPEITRALACPRDHIQVHDFVPQLEVLRRASLHITHGGSSSVKESILLGVPMLVYPRGADQPGNAARVVFHGLGARGEIDSAQPRHIAETVRRLMDDRAIHDSVGRMREHFLRYDERSTAELLGRIAGV
jgi:MGT family glycosyltransferase